MTDWNKIAAGVGLVLPADDAEKIMAPLRALEATLAPLTNILPMEIEPVTEFRAEEDE